MSGILGTVAKVGGIASTIADILGLSSTSITLGDQEFTDIAMPARMTWGGHMRLVRQTLPGGKVVIHSLGPDWSPIRWQGILEGPSASRTAKQIYAMMLACEVIPLAWLDQTWQVVIQEFTADDITAGWVTYRINCAVSADPSQAYGPDQPSLFDQVTGDISDALGFDVVDAAGTAMTVLGKVQQAAGLAGALTKGTSTFTALAGAVGIAQGAVGGAVSLAEAGINGLQTVTSGAQQALAWVNGATTQTGNLANAVAAQGPVDRIAVNLNNAGT